MSREIVLINFLSQYASTKIETFYNKTLLFGMSATVEFVKNSLITKFGKEKKNIICHCLNSYSILRDKEQTTFVDSTHDEIFERKIR